MSVLYFPKWSFEEVKKALPQLKLLHFDKSTAPAITFDLNYFSQFKMPMVIYTDMLVIHRRSHLDELLRVLKTCNIVKLIIDHLPGDCQFRWPFNQFERIINEVPKLKLTISLGCLDFTQKNAKDFF